MSSASSAPGTSEPWRTSLEDLAGEETREEAAVRSRYEDVRPYVSSVALVLAVTEEDAETWGRQS